MKDPIETIKAELARHGATSLISGDLPKAICAALEAEGIRFVHPDEVTPEMVSAADDCLPYSLGPARAKEAIAAAIRAGRKFGDEK